MRFEPVEVQLPDRGVVFRSLATADRDRLASFYGSLSDRTRAFWHGDADAGILARDQCDAISRFDKLRLVADDGSVIVAVFELSFSIPDGDHARFAGYGVSLDERKDVRFGPSCVTTSRARGSRLASWPKRPESRSARAAAGSSCGAACSLTTGELVASTSGKGSLRLGVHRPSSTWCARSERTPPCPSHVPGAVTRHRAGRPITPIGLARVGCPDRRHGDSPGQIVACDDTAWVRGAPSDDPLPCSGGVLYGSITSSPMRSPSMRNR